MVKLKPYISDNMDGRNRGMVAAATLPEAAKKLRTSVYHMRQMGWRIGTADDAKAALASPDTILYRPIDNNHGYPWSAVRYERDYSGVATYKLMKFRDIKGASE